MDIAWKIWNTWKAAMKFKISIIFFAILREGPIAHKQFQTI